MSLQVWLPLNGNIENIGVNGSIITSTLGTVSFVDNGKIGKAFVSGGTTQVQNGVSLSTNFLDIFGTTASVAAWVKPLGDHYHYNGTILSSGNWNQKKWAFGVSQDNTKVDVLCGSYNDWVDCPVPVGEWTHLACVYNNGTSTLYKNGILVGSKSGLKAFDSDASITCVGRETYASGYFGFNGYINDVRIYDHCLSAKEVKEISKALVLHYKCDNQASISGANLLVGTADLTKWSKESATTITYTSDGYYCIRSTASSSSSRYGYYQDVTLSPNTTYTFSAEIRDRYHIGTEPATGFTWNTTSNVDSTGDRRYVHTFTTTDANYKVRVYLYGYNRENGETYIRFPKIEVGDSATPWVPNVADAEYNGLNVVGNNIVDSSGYGHSATLTNVTYDVDSPRYGNCTVFSGSTSYLKVDENKWMAQYAEEMTINFWAYSSNWSQATAGRLLSCTESGGFNIEAGDSGYSRFAIYVATNAAHSSHSYFNSISGGSASNKSINMASLSAGWHMFTCVYSTGGLKFYIDGNLHNTISVATYGLRYNTSARLFLGCEANSANPSSPWFNGRESDFRLYYTVLSAEDILDLYHTSAAVDKDGNVYSREIVEV